MDTRLSAGRPAQHPRRLGELVEDITAVASTATTLLRLPITAVMRAEARVAQGALPVVASSVHASATAPTPQDVTALAGSATRTSNDHTGLPARPPLSAEGAVVAVVAVVAVATGSWIALGGAMALGYVLVRSAHTRLRSRLRKTERAAVEPGWRKSA